MSNGSVQSDSVTLVKHNYLPTYFAEHPAGRLSKKGYSMSVCQQQIEHCHN